MTAGSGWEERGWGYIVLNGFEVRIEKGEEFYRLGRRPRRLSGGYVGRFIFS